MEKLILDKIDKDEVLRYIGWKDNTPPDINTESEIIRQSETALKSITPRAIHAYFTIDELTKANLLCGNDIALHLQNCTHAIAFALTIGSEIEQEIRIAQSANALAPVVLDACATVAVEALCDKYTDMLTDLYGKHGMYLTGRFSPGYGDFPIEKQHILLSLADAQRKIGLFATQNSILTPRKSVTALIGVSDKTVVGRLAGCKSCVLASKCEYIRRGTTCNV